MKSSSLRYLLTIAAAVSCGCAPALTPRLADAPAPRDFYAQVNDKETTCGHEVAVFPAGATVPRPHKELASLSATCSPGATDLCERRLKERACALGADGLILIESAPGANPAGASNQSLVARNGRAIVWER